MNKKTEKNLQKNGRYASVSYRGVKGIRQDTKNQTFLVAKSIRGKRYSATFDNIREAADWKKNFHPGLSLVPLGNPKKEKALKSLSEMSPFKKHRNAITIKNGTDYGYKFSDIWEMYLEKHLTRLEYSTYCKAVQRAKHFFTGMMNVKMVDITANFISEYLELEREKALKKTHIKRYNFNADLKYLKSFLNWYRENVDAMFVNPVLKRHKQEGFIHKIPKRKKKMSRHELLAFFESLGKDDILWRELAEVQFYFSGRIQEVAGLQWESVDFTDGVIEIENVTVWGVNRKFCYLKDSPKNREERKVPITDRLFEILKRRWAIKRPSMVEDKRTGKTFPCNFVFHQEGRPLDYCRIQYCYNQALKRAGLGDKYASTHILRHSMANLVRERMGLEHAQAVGGWKTRELVEHVYTDRPAHLTANALKNIEDYMGTVDDEGAKRCYELTRLTAKKVHEKRAKDVQIK